MELTTTNKRFYEYDFARAIPMLFLPLVHVYEELDFMDYLSGAGSSIGEFILYLCALGPSIFMMIAGMNICFSKSATPDKLAKRGFKMIIVFFIHNILRFLLPSIVPALCTGDVWDWIYDGIWSCLWSDIIFLAGGCFLYFALIKKLKITPLGSLLISLVLLAIHTPISCTVEESGLLLELLGNFVHVTENSAFPLMSWMVFPSIGYVLGSYLVKLDEEKDRKQFYNKMLLTSLVVLLITGITLYTYGLDPILISASPANDYITDLFNVILDAALGGVWFSVSYYIWSAIKSLKVRETIVRLSKLLTVFYLIQWIFVGWLEYLLFPYEGTNSIGFLFVIIISLVFLAATLALSFLYEKKKTEKSIL